MIATSGLHLLCMAGVTLAILAGRANYPRFKYDPDTQILYLDPALTIREASHICDGVLEMVVSRALDSALQGPSPAE